MTLAATPLEQIAFPRHELILMLTATGSSDSAGQPSFASDHCADVPCSSCQGCGAQSVRS